MQISQFFMNGDIKGAIGYMRNHEEFKDVLPAYVAIFENCEYRTYEMPGMLNDILRLYQIYFRDTFYCGLSEAEAADKLLTGLRALLNMPDADEALLAGQLQSVFEAEGYHALFGKTQGYYGPYIWRDTVPTVYRVELPDGTAEYTVNILKGFAFRSWMDYLTFGRYGTGGWTTPDGTINCVEQAYDFESERFLVSLLKHEAQHTVDMKQFPEITPAELEYRAKLVELHYSGDLSLLQKFISEADESKANDSHRINEDVVLSLVSEILKAIAEYAKHDRAEFVRVVQEAQSSQQTAEVRKQRTRLATAKQRVSELEVLLCKIYEDNILGKLSDSRYATLDAQYAKEQAELTAEISTLEKAIKSYETHEKDADRFIALIDKYENFDKLTIAMLNEFIEKILVHERDRKGSTQTTQEVEIYFNFVGRFVPPAFGEVELTPEELEEIRKREERKDRLHQNYLKRKASGAQKRYEDKIKERKKAEIEAKKAAIRAEDIAKGVFVPVSSLPQREPQKGAQIA